MHSSEIGSASPAIALAAAIFISSLISRARTSRAPRKIPGNPRTLFTWLGKSDLPVAMILAPAFLARSGMISGTGFAMAKTMGSSAIDLTISSDTIPGAETPMNTSAPPMASASDPVLPLGLVILAISIFEELRSERPL